jgi:hypothetical protein
MVVLSSEVVTWSRSMYCRVPVCSFGMWFIIRCHSRGAAFDQNKLVINLIVLL